MISEVPRIIGLAGAARAGKDTLADMIAIHLAYQRDRFASPIYDCIGLITGLGYEELQTKKDQVDPLFGKSPRVMLQTLGTEWGRDMIDPEIWVHSMQARHPTGGVVISDVRFRNEADWIRSREGVTLYVFRPGQKIIAESGHASENGVTADDCDLSVVNGGTIDDLRANVNAYCNAAMAIHQQLRRQ